MTHPASQVKCPAWGETAGRHALVAVAPSLRALVISACPGPDHTDAIRRQWQVAPYKVMGESKPFRGICQETSGQPCLQAKWAALQNHPKTVSIS